MTKRPGLAPSPVIFFPTAYELIGTILSSVHESGEIKSAMVVRHDRHKDVKPSSILERRRLECSEPPDTFPACLKIVIRAVCVLTVYGVTCLCSISRVVQVLVPMPYTHESV